MNSSEHTLYINLCEEIKKNLNIYSDKSISEKDRVVSGINIARYIKNGYLLIDNQTNCSDFYLEMILKNYPQDPMYTFLNMAKFGKLSVDYDKVMKLFERNLV